AWVLDLPAVRDQLPELRAMAPNSALGVFAASIGLFCLTVRLLRPLAWMIGVAIVLAGIAVLLQDIFGFDLGLDNAVLRNLPIASEGAARPAALRISPGLLSSLLLCGLALLAAKSNRVGSGLSQILAVAM